MLAHVARHLENKGSALTSVSCTLHLLPTTTAIEDAQLTPLPIPHPMRLLHSVQSLVPPNPLRLVAGCVVAVVSKVRHRALRM